MYHVISERYLVLYVSYSCIVPQISLSCCSVISSVKSFFALSFLCKILGVNYFITTLTLSEAGSEIVQTAYAVVQFIKI